MFLFFIQLLFCDHHIKENVVIVPFQNGWSFADVCKHYGGACKPVMVTTENMQYLIGKMKERGIETAGVGGWNGLETPMVLRTTNVLNSYDKVTNPTCHIICSSGPCSSSYANECHVAPQPCYQQPTPQPCYPQPAPQPCYPQPCYPQPAPQPCYPQPTPQPCYPQPTPQPCYPQPCYPKEYYEPCYEEPGNKFWFKETCRPIEYDICKPERYTSKKYCMKEKPDCISDCNNSSPCIALLTILKVLKECLCEKESCLCKIITTIIEIIKCILCKDAENKSDCLKKLIECLCKSEENGKLCNGGKVTSDKEPITRSDFICKDLDWISMGKEVDKKMKKYLSKN